jgi:tetratricopeptide (TPR) repeat protein
VELALRDGRLNEALAFAAALAAVHPDEPFATFLVASAHHRLEQWSEAAAAWERYAAQSTSPESACPQIAVAYDRVGDAKRALASYRACVERDPGNPDRVADLAAALASRRAVDEARQLYDRAIALDPDNPLLVAEKAALR